MLRSSKPVPVKLLGKVWLSEKKRYQILSEINCAQSLRETRYSTASSAEKLLVFPNNVTGDESWRRGTNLSSPLVRATV